MSSFEKLVKLACKPKSAAPKSKYIEPLISATYADDGSIHDICKALAPRFREPNAVIVFKALIVLHSIIRQGQTDNVLKYLASSDVLRLRNVTNGQWDGYMAPQNISRYAMYLDCRVRTYKDLKHDAIRVQSESNRDRLSTTDDEGPSSGRPVQRSKTIMGRKLRVMTVEKGLLRETKMVQRLTDALLECKLYDDNLDDELNVTALRMLVKDLLILFQATNEGVINVLEHYFEMSQVDAGNALKIYQHFCKQTERVVNYLGIAKKLQNVLNVQIPNLRHAPVSLAKTLEEYLKDPNFEENRLEYRNSKLIADGKKDDKAPEPKPNPTIKIPENSTAGASTSKESAKPDKSELMDFFASIEQEQPNMFDPHSQSPTNNYFQQQSQFNPFVQRQSIITGMNGQQPFIQPQATGFVPGPNNPFPQQSQPFLVPQATAVPFQPQAQPLQPQATAMPFLQPQATAMPFLQPQDTAMPFLQPQDTARPFQLQQQQPFGQPAPFLQPQATGSNPFRQTMLFPQSTGMPTQNPFPPSNPFPTNPFPSSNPTTPLPSNTNNPVSTGTGAGAMAGTGIARPASTPIGGAERKSTSFGQTMAPLVAQTTGSRNPFGPVAPAPPPPVPKLPTLGELASGAFGGANAGGAGQAQGAFGQTQGGLGQTQGGLGQSNGGLGQTNGSMQPQPTGMPSKSPFDMSSIASSFTFDPSNATKDMNPGEMKPLDPQATATSSAFSSDRMSIFSAQPTGSSLGSFGSGSGSLVPQVTGFGGSNVKPFKPTSSFGAELMDNLPGTNSSSSFSGSSTSPFGAAKTGGTDSTTPSFSFSSALGQGSGLGSQSTGLSSQPTGLGSQLTGLSSQPTGLGSQPTGLGASGLSSQPTGAFGSTLGTGTGPSLGVGLRPQMTGLGGAAGGANPFRASMFNNLGSGAGAGTSLGTGSNPFPLGATGMTPFGGSTTLGGSTSPFGSAPTGQQSQQQQQQPSFSLI